MCLFCLQDPEGDAYSEISSDENMMADIQDRMVSWCIACTHSGQRLVSVLSPSVFFISLTSRLISFLFRETGQIWRWMMPGLD